MIEPRAAELRARRRAMQWSVLLSSAAVVCGCGPAPPPADEQRAQIEDPSAELARVAQGPASDSIVELRQRAVDPDYRVRERAVTAAAGLADPAATQILTSGLQDESINVRLAAAQALAARPYPAATDAVLEQIATSPDETVREILIAAAGHLPGPRTSTALKQIEREGGPLAGTARLALAKLGDTAARAAVLANLGAAAPRARYDALAALTYIGEESLAARALDLLGDKASALPIGVLRAGRYRRVCDQAVDTIVLLRRLTPGFETGPERIYSDDELGRIRTLTR